jgi:hypothetical protein
MKNKTKTAVWLASALAAASLQAQVGTPATSWQTAQAQTRTTPEGVRAFRPVLRFGLDDVLVEAGAFGAAPEADRAVTVRASPYLLWQPDRAWELRLGLRLDAVSQRGGLAPYDDARADIGDTYVRFRSGDARVTLGAQTIVWGRVDAIPVADRVSRVDLTRFILDDLAERRRAQWALRWEQNLGDDLKVDAVLLPRFRPARLPDQRSVWHPINRSTGRIIGYEPDPALAALIGVAELREEQHHAGGAAVRLSSAGGFMDWGVTVARTRQSMPYYRVDAGVPALTAVHPYNRFIGIDLETTAAGATWRAEVGYTGGVPATRPGGQMIDTSAVEAVAGVEFFPGGKNTRATLQLAARSLRADGALLELKDYVGVNGEIESTFGEGRWRASLRFMSGLNVHDVYIAPKLSYVGWEPHELFVVARHFSGEGRAWGGFHRDHGMLAVGLKTRF